MKILPTIGPASEKLNDLGATLKTHPKQVLDCNQYGKNWVIPMGTIKAS